jgi:serine/threonine-protein kinase
MPEIGQTISHYRIIEKLGQGGMGEVFLAHDASLDRNVALKFLPDIFSGDLERLARFEREAKLLASLNHPNIATIYGLEQADGKRFLAVELVEGETLAQQTERGPLSVEEALEVCRQIAEGLEAAHEKGVIHRDLKPANVKITPEGKVKILDFGLAKAFQGDAPTADASKSPTLTDQMTRPGVILGTAAYMSPEQAKGRSVDKRTDIWAFGCILYECLTGMRPFQGDTVTETLASILKGEPDWNLLPKDANAKIRDVLQRCLQKDLKLRYRDIADAWLEIESPATHPSEAVLAPPRFSLLWLAACAAIMLLAGILIDRLLTRTFQSATPTSAVKSIIKVEPGHWLDGMLRADEMQRPSRTAMAISSNGDFVVYTAIEESPGPQTKSRLYMRKMDQLEAKLVPGTEGGINPFLSPDNRWVGFWAEGKLKKVPVEGGIPTPLCDASMLFGANWGDNDGIVFADGYAAGLSRISSAGGGSASPYPHQIRSGRSHATACHPGSPTGRPCCLP